MGPFTVKRTSRAIGLLAALITFLGCSKPREIQSIEPRGGDQIPNWENPDAAQQASIVTLVPEEDLYKILDRNSVMEFDLTYLSTTKRAQLAISQGQARIEAYDLPVNQSGQLSITLLENNTSKAEGKADNVTLRPGINNIRLTFVPASDPGTGNNGGGNSNDDGGSNGGGNSNDGGSGGSGNNPPPPSDTAGLVITIEYEPATPNPPPESRFQREILPLTTANCISCHRQLGYALPDNEDYFKARKSVLKMRLDKSYAGTMPPRDSEEAKKLSDSDRAKLVDFVNGL